MLELCPAPPSLSEAVPTLQASAMNSNFTPTGAHRNSSDLKKAGPAPCQM